MKTRCSKLLWKLLGALGYPKFTENISFAYVCLYVQNPPFPTAHCSGAHPKHVILTSLKDFVLIIHSMLIRLVCAQMILLSQFPK